MDKKSRRIIAVMVTVLMLVMSFAEVPAVFAAEESGDEPDLFELFELQSEEEAQELQDADGVEGPEVLLNEEPAADGEQPPQEGEEEEEEDPADYTELDKAIETAPDDLSIYTDETAAAVEAAVKAGKELDRNLPKSEQAKVDAAAAAINDAVSKLVKKEAPGEVVIDGHPIKFPDGKYYYVRLYGTVADSVKKKPYNNSEGKVKVTLDARWYQAQEETVNDTLYVTDPGKNPRGEDKYAEVVKKGWKFVYAIKSTNGTKDDLTDDVVIEGNLTYDDIAQKGKNKGKSINVKNDQTLYLEAQATDPNGQTFIASSLPRIVRYVFLDAPKNVKVKCDDGDNVATISWKAVKGARKYAIYMSTNGKCPAEPIAYTKKDSGDKTYVKKNLEGPKTYTFFVKAMFYNEAKSTGGTGGTATKFWTVSKASSGEKLKITDRLLGIGIRAIRWKYNLKYAGTLYSNAGCTKKKGTIAKGTKVYCVAKIPRKIPRGGHATKFQVQVEKNGKVIKKGWVKYGPIRTPSGEVAYKSGKAYNYSKSAIENYVNSKGFSSSKRYLIWVNTYTQRVNIFTGKKGNWELQHSWRCTSGVFFQWTSLGSNYKVHRHQAKKVRNFLNSTSQYYYRNLSYFSKGNSFHTYCWRVGSNKVVNHVKGNLQPGTKGCIRMGVPEATWIYNNIPLGTKVVVH